MKNTVWLDGKSLTIDDVINVAINNFPIGFPAKIKSRIKKQRAKLEHQIENRPDIAIYGTNRLHGDLKDVAISIDKINEYQVKYIMVHNCGTGNALPVAAVRAIMLIRLNSFARGMSGIRLETCQLLIDMLNKGVTPWVQEEGSVGASGDLVPLAMIGAVMIKELGKEAKAYYKGKLMSAKKALKKAGLKPIVLGAKEAMGLTNGSNFISGIAALMLHRAEQVLKMASVSAALSLEAIRGEKKAFSAIINKKSNRHEGQILIADQINRLIRGSQRMSIPAQMADVGGNKGRERVQDRYSFRAVPQVHGTTHEALVKLRSVLEVEINSTTDNPIFDFDRTDVKGEGILFASGANFHGQPLAAVIDYVKITLTSLALITDKRAFSMLDEGLSYGLPADLAFDTMEADGGLMIAQYAGAARVAECRVLSTPASVTSVATAANQEDFVSMGSIGVLHLGKILDNLEKVVGIELLCAHRGLQLTYDKLPSDLRELGKGTAKAYRFLSEKKNLPAGKNNKNLKDHYLRTDLEKATKIVKSGVMLDLVKL